jgi:hypothetical protein
MNIINTSVWGFQHAVRGARNPLESWAKSDMGICKGGDNGIGCDNCCEQDKCHHSYDNLLKLGKNDLNLLQRLVLAGSDERKFMRQIYVSTDITAPLYWWKEFDTYKVGTVANSTSTMHKLATTPITINCFEQDEEDLEMPERQLTTHMMLNSVMNHCEILRQKYLDTKDIRYWRALIQLLPESWLQTRTVTMNYENLRNMYFARRHHKLSEWHYFCSWVKSLPYAEELIMLEKTER